MSVTITAIPFLLLSGALAKASISVFEAISLGITEVNNAKNKGSIHLSDKQKEELLNREFETEITDTDTLIKTLEEHGADNILQEESNISCDCDNFHLDFFKAPDSPYFMRISFKEGAEPEELIDNINMEYRANAQEISYNKIKERLEAQNYKIDEEEIYDDNTIVLTVNLE